MLKQHDTSSPYCAHFCEVKDSLVAMIDTLREELSKLLIVEDLEGTAWWDLAHCGGVEAVVVVAVARLHKDGRVRQTLGIHFPSHVVEMDSCKYEVVSI